MLHANYSLGEDSSGVAFPFQLSSHSLKKITMSKDLQNIYSLLCPIWFVYVGRCRTHDPSLSHRRILSFFCRCSTQCRRLSSGFRYYCHLNLWLHPIFCPTQKAHHRYPGTLLCLAQYYPWRPQTHRQYCIHER
jgi:hypothetical protein